MHKEAALIIGAVVAGLNALAALIGLGGLDDGFQWADAVFIGTPIVGALGIRASVWSQQAVDLLAPRTSQDRVLEAKRTR